MSRDGRPISTLSEFVQLSQGAVDFAFEDPRDYEPMVKWSVDQFGRGYYFGIRPTPLTHQIRSIDSCNWCLTWVLDTGAPRHKMAGRFIFRNLNDTLLFKLTWVGR